MVNIVFIYLICDRVIIKNQFFAPLNPDYFINTFFYNYY